MRELTIEVTQQCMNKCIYCSSYSNGGTPIKMPTDKSKQVISEAKELGFTHVNFCVDFSKESKIEKYNKGNYIVIMKVDASTIVKLNSETIRG